MSAAAPACIASVEVNAYGRVIRDLGQRSGREPGQDVYLTLDRRSAGAMPTRSMGDGKRRHAW